MTALFEMFAPAAALGALAVALWWLRKRVPPSFRLSARRKPEFLKPVQRLQLTPSHSLHLVRYGNRAMLIAVGPSGARLMDTTEWREDC